MRMIQPPSSTWRVCVVEYIEVDGVPCTSYVDPSTRTLCILDEPPPDDGPAVSKPGPVPYSRRPAIRWHGPRRQNRGGDGGRGRR
jgi:hypothetical protein